MDENQNQDDLVVDGAEDEAALDDTVIPEAYDITSYGADYDVDGLVRRLNKDEVLIPTFQRQYVWNLTEASRFVESLLLGLPVPGVFLVTEPETRKFLVIDGQQRLRTLQFFFAGVFNPKPDQKSQRVFKLDGVQEQFEGRTYEELEETDRRRLDNSIIHATIVKQNAPADDDTSVFHIFERLNNGGRRLTDQEIRVALYNGTLIERIKDINKYEPWRKVFGGVSPRLKDQEFILRVFALLVDGAKYEKPMKEFLNKFAGRYKAADSDTLTKWSNIFTRTIDVIVAAVGDTAFRIGRPINAAVFDSVMVAVAELVAGGKEPQKLAENYARLLKDADYLNAVTKATSDENSVVMRLGKAREYLAS